ncbi:MAG: hypothetical protein J5700_04945 [Treponema sp.]|nr:hypothetical protein [Treponema sp.]
MAKQPRTWGIFVCQLSLAIYFVVTAICLITRVGSSISSAEINAVAALFGKAAPVISVLIGIILAVCGIMFAFKAFGIDFGKIDDYIKYVTIVLWIIITVITLIFYIKEWTSVLVLHWLLVLAKNALIIGSTLTIKNGK